MTNILLIGGNGYIGSNFYKNSAHKMSSVDINLFGQNLNYSYAVNYDQINVDNFDVIILLAGHSSVPMCEFSPNRSWDNNVNYFHNLCKRINKNQKLIYASSASVYGITTDVSTEDSDINFNVLNHYDLQKITIDLIANKYIAEGKNIIGLRFGTVNGLSPNTRSDLIINSMVKSAIQNGVVNVKNKHIRRAILGINDICKALDVLVEIDIKSGQYNLSSFNSQVGQIANTVAEYTGAKLIEQANDKLAYDFMLSTEKFVNATGFQFADTIESLIKGLHDHMDSIQFDVRDNDRFFEKYYNK